MSVPAISRRQERVVDRPTLGGDPRSVLPWGRGPQGSERLAPLRGHRFRLASDAGQSVPRQTVSGKRYWTEEVFIVEYRDPQRCAACGGECCAIYRPEEEGGSFPSWEWWFPDWVAAWAQRFEESGALTCGVEPLFDPLEAHLPGMEDLRQWIVAQGGHPDYCQYWRRDGGCTLPWERRPRVCREYRCPEWQREGVTR